MQIVKAARINLTLVVYLVAVPALAALAEAVVKQIQDALEAAGFGGAFSPKAEPHGTVLGLEQVAVGSRLYNANFLNNRGELKQQDLHGLASLLPAASKDGVIFRARFGGFRPAHCKCSGSSTSAWRCSDPDAEFHSCDRTPYEGSVYMYADGPAMMTGWPYDGPNYPRSLFGLRLAAEGFGLLDKYHGVEISHWKDDDFYIGLGRIGKVPRTVLNDVEERVRGWMSQQPPVECDVRLEDLSFVLYRNSGLEPGKGHILEMHSVTSVMNDLSLLDRMERRVRIGSDYDRKYAAWAAAICTASLQQGQRKYFKTGEPRPYPGYSVIHNVEPCEELAKQITSTANTVRQKLGTLAEKFAFVKVDSFHMTTFDLINEPEFSEKGLTGYAELANRVRDYTVDWLREHHKDLRGTARINGTGLFAGNGILKLDVEFDSETAAAFTAFRSDLHAHLCATCKEYGYAAWREEGWAKGLSAHITLAYLVKPLVPVEADSLVAALRDFNDCFAGLELTFTRGDVMTFDDMDCYYKL
jgi:hypothetical protein